MIGITEAARRQIDSLAWFYLEEKQRPAAAFRLLRELAEARRLIVADPHGGLPSPRPYPDLATFGFRWILVGRSYWVAWAMIGDRPVVTNVFHASADIEGHATPGTDDVSDW